MRNLEHNHLRPDGFSQLPVVQRSQKIIDTLSRTGILQRGRGQCISMSDLVSSLLEDQGIKSEMMECTLIVTKEVGPGQHQLDRIGDDGLSHDDQVDTHMVVITHTDPPVIIDTAVQGLVPGVNYIIEPVISDGDVITRCQFQHSLWVYQRRQHTRMPQHYQQSIRARLDLDRRVDQNIRWLKIMVAVALAVSSVNALRGAYDFYMVYVAENNWGPRSLEQLHEKVQRLEQQQ